MSFPDNHIKSEFFLISGNDYKSFVNDSGGRNVNSLASINPGKKQRAKYSKLRNFTFQYRARTISRSFYKYQMPNKTNFYANKLILSYRKFQENRRFGLWLEGIIFGSILTANFFVLFLFPD